MVIKGNGPLSLQKLRSPDLGTTELGPHAQKIEYLSVPVRETTCLVWDKHSLPGHLDLQTWGVECRSHRASSGLPDLEQLAASLTLGVARFFWPKE